MGVFPSVVIYIVAALVVWAILQIVESLESIGMGGASFASSSALSREQWVEIHLAPARESSSVATSSTPTRSALAACLIVDLLLLR